METTEIALKPATDGQSFLEANKAILEQCAVQALMSVMNSACHPSVKLEATAQAFDILGKSKPTQSAPTGNTFNIINPVVASKASEALAGLAQTMTLMNVTPKDSAEVVEPVSVIMPPKSAPDSVELEGDSFEPMTV